MGPTLAKRLPHTRHRPLGHRHGRPHLPASSPCPRPGFAPLPSAATATRGHTRPRLPARPTPRGCSQLPDASLPADTDLRSQKQQDWRDVLSAQSAVDATLRAIPQALLTTGRDGTVRGFNPAAERLTGSVAASIIGRHFTAIFVPTLGTEGDPAEALAGVLRSGRPAGPVSARWRDRSGGEPPADLRSRHPRSSKATAASADWLSHCRNSGSGSSWSTSGPVSSPWCPTDCALASPASAHRRSCC